MTLLNTTHKLAKLSIALTINLLPPLMHPLLRIYYSTSDGVVANREPERPAIWLTTIHSDLHRSSQVVQTNVNRFTQKKKNLDHAPLLSPPKLLPLSTFRCANLQSLIYGKHGRGMPALLPVPHPSYSYCSVYYIQNASKANRRLYCREIEDH